jgi:hypothetical protein
MAYAGLLAANQSLVAARGWRAANEAQARSTLIQKNASDK